VTSTDFNGDNKADLATANAPSISYIPNAGGGAGNVSVLLGNGDGTFETAHNFAAGDTPVYLASADFNGDSKVDLAVANSQSNDVSVLSGNNDASFQTAQNFAAGTNPSALVGARFNNDSKVDLAVTNDNSDDVSILLNNTDTTSPRVESTSPHAGATGVSPTANVKATFSEGMNASTVNATTFELFEKGTTTKLGATISYDATAHRATLDPTNSLKRGVTYKGVVTTGAKDVTGNRLDQNPSLSGLQPKQWFFTVKN
jgi:Bacterial Ig-like domain/FG-GAP-like repeat